MTGSKRRGFDEKAEEKPDPALIGLAREIQAEILRVGEGGDAQALVDAIQAVPERERLLIARQVFDRLPADRQWSVLTEVFDDTELRAALDARRRARLEKEQRAEEIRRLLPTPSLREVDLSLLEAGLSISVGLFTERDVTAALQRGAESSSCARRIDAHSEGNGNCRVLNDVFNPGGGYFVTRTYDEDTWRNERLRSHATVRIGSAGGSDRDFEPVLYAGGRVDFEVDGAPVLGQLHLGFLVVEDVDIFLEGSNL